MKPSSAEEYRKRAEDRRRARKLVPLPSGAVFEIKKIDVLACAHIFKKNKGVLDEIAKEQDELKLAELLRGKEVAALITESVTKPTIVDLARGPEDLSINDLEGMDLITLFNEIILFNDLDRFTAGKLSSFRKEQLRTGGGALSGEVPQIA